jgi:carbon-monoxide dehydrogenase large subunit
MMGARVKRLEDPRLLRGQAGFVDDIRLPGALHAAILRSPHAHARLRGIDLSAARRAPGVAAAFSLADLWPEPPAIPVLIPHPSFAACAQYPLARDRVRYAGEPVAVVVADDRYRAEDALEAARADYEPLPAIVETGAPAGAVSLHEGAPDNIAARWTDRKGDVEAAFRRADCVVGERFRMQRYTGVPIEARGIVASHDAVTGDLTIWASTQWPHTARALTAALLGLEERRVRVILPEVGGGFGVKAELYPEDLLVPLAAVRTGRPVKWIEDRREHLLGTVHAREMTFELELALRADGTILGLRGRILCDQGAYVRTLGVINPSLASATLPGPYRIEHHAVEVVCALTTKSPISPYRGAGQPESAYARERLLDVAARELGMDPAELRLKNLVTADAMPYTTGLASVEGPVVLDSGDFPAALRLALERAGYAEFRRGQARARSEGRHRGLGLCVFTQISGMGPFESAEVRVDGAGHVTVVSGAAPQGQGSATTLAQLVADELDVPLERIRVVFGDTGRIPFGVGTFASRNAVVAGSATAVASQRVRDKAVQLAAHLLEVSPADLEWTDGAARVRGVPDRLLTLAQLAQAAGPGGRRPAGMEPGLEARHYFETHDSPYSYGVHVAEVDVDPETGAVTVRRYVVVNDAGRLINPTIVEGQIVGGIAQGLGGALLEELVYDAQGQLMTTSLLDYLLPTSMEVPAVEVTHLETPTPLNPLGVKGLGEGGAVAAHAAVANAVADALAHTGARVRATPLGPGAIHRLLQTERA